MKNRILFVDSKRKNEIDTLRIQSYKKADGFALDLSTLKWKPADDESFILAAEVNGELISTMRGEVIADQSILEKKLECPWDFPLEIEMPVLTLSRAATLSSYRTSGLNLLLRYWFLRFAITHQIQFVIGTFVSGSPRENTLREMGYQFFENKLGWQQSTYRSQRPVTVVALDLKTNGHHALQYCLEKLPHAISDYYFDGHFPALRLVRSV